MTITKLIIQLLEAFENLLGFRPATIAIYYCGRSYVTILYPGGYWQLYKLSTFDLLLNNKIPLV